MKISIAEPPLRIQRLPKADQVEREPHLRKHWVSLTATRWVSFLVVSNHSTRPGLIFLLQPRQDFRTSSEHRVTVVWKTVSLAYICVRLK